MNNASGPYAPFQRWSRTVFLLLLAASLGACSSDDDHPPVPSPVPGPDAVLTPTTLSQTIMAVDSPQGTRTLKSGSGEAHEVRSLSGIPEPVGSDSRSLAYWWVWGDPQLADEENPTRLGFFDAASMFFGMFTSAFRPQEDISPHLLNASVLTANAVMSDYGREFDVGIGLGDIADNATAAEIGWMVDILDGSGQDGMVRPDTGDMDMVDGRNRGARDFGTQESYNPFVREGMPDSNADFPAPGLVSPSDGPVPWFSVVGNHDALHMGNFPVDDSPIEDPVFGNFIVSGDDYTGDVAPFGYLRGLPNLVMDTIPGNGPPQAFFDLIAGPDLGDFLSNPFFLLGLVGLLSDGIAAIEAEIDPNFDFSQLIPDPFDPDVDELGIPVTTDPGRAFVGTQGFVQALRDNGHGFELDQGACAADFPGGVAPDKGYFALDAPSALGQDVPVRMIFLNTAEYPLVAEGGMTQAQWDWLDCQLQLAVDDKVLVVVISHHPADDLLQVVDQESPNLARTCAGPACAQALVSKLQSVPNTIAHLVGHGHDNRIIPRQAGTPANSYWEIQTCSIIDWPQQTRILEIVAYQNRVGEIWSTMLDHALLSTDDNHNRLTELARLLAANDAERDNNGDLGGEKTASDRNRVLRFLIPEEIMTRISSGDGRITSRDVLPLAN